MGPLEGRRESAALALPGGAGGGGGGGGGSGSAAWTWTSTMKARACGALTASTQAASRFSTYRARNRAWTIANWFSQKVQPDARALLRDVVLQPVSGSAFQGEAQQQFVQVVSVIV